MIIDIADPKFDLVRTYKEFKKYCESCFRNKRDVVVYFNLSGFAWWVHPYVEPEEMDKVRAIIEAWLMLGFIKKHSTYECWRFIKCRHFPQKFRHETKEANDDLFLVWR
jgi:hypothetical protein